MNCFLILNYGYDSYGDWGSDVVYIASSIDEALDWTAGQSNPDDYKFVEVKGGIPQR